MEKIQALIYLKPESCFSSLRAWIAGRIPDFNCTTADDKETFITMIINGYPDIILIEDTIDGESGLAFIENIRKESITVPFILLLEDFDEPVVKRIVALGGCNFILKSDDVLAVRQKLTLAKQLILNSRSHASPIEDRGSRARIDELTDVPGRQEFMKKLRDGEEKTLILLNIDDFGLINDTYGIGVGDKILTKAALVTKRLIPTDSILYRISGDEFAIFIPNPGEEHGIRLIRKVRNVFARERISVENLELSISFTIGFATGKEAAILQKADIALRRAREIGRNRYEEYRYDPELEKRQTENLEWAQKIVHAIEHDRFFPMFQPIVDNNQRKVVMYECLARMIDADKIIGPNIFIDPAKRSGLMPYITRTITEKSFATFSGFPYGFSVNICELDLQDNYLVGFIEAMLLKYSVQPERFIVEISEGVQSIQHQADLDQILALKGLGVKIAFDDFGKGNPNFCRILDLMPDFIKIDGSFIRHLDKNGHGYKISHAITQFGKSIDSQVIAEYVHSKEVLDRVLRLDVQYSQGYYFGKPHEAVTGCIEGESAG